MSDHESLEAYAHTGRPDWVTRLYRVPVLGGIVYLILPPKKATTRKRRVASWALGVLALLGVAMAGYPYAGHYYPGPLAWPVEKAIEWSNLFSDLESNRIQGDLATEWQKHLASGDLSIGEGKPLTRLTIPAIKVDTIVVEGTSPSALKAGAGHYPRTPLPGAVGNVAIAGHRTTYGRPFNKVDKLKVGDEIILETPKGRHIYKLTRKPWVTGPNDGSVVDNTDQAALLTLTTCHPKGSARQRLIVRAELVKSEPLKV